MKIIRPVNITTQATFSRNSIATYFDKNGVLQTAPINLLRIGYDPVTHEMIGPIVENQITNYARLNASWSGTKYGLGLPIGVQVTFSFYGTGIVTLSGGGSGVVNGLGSFPTRTSYTFTTTSADITFSCSGTVEYVQLEVGTSATSYFPILTVSDTGVRSADIVTGNGLVYSNISEAEYPEWDSLYNYSVGDRVIRYNVHKVYQNLTAGINSNLPELDISGRWIEVGPTNKWAAFDQSMSTSTSNTNEIIVILKPGRVSGLALLGMNATFAEIAMVSNGETVYSGSADLTNGTVIGDWYEYFYEPIYQRDSLIITELIDAALLNLPQYGDSLISIRIAYQGQTPSVSAIVVGLVADIGLTQYDSSIGIVDYSKLNVDDFGRTTIVKRTFSKKNNINLVIENNKIDYVSRLLSLYRATPIVWVGTDNIYQSLVLYGFYRDWDITLSNPTFSNCSIQIEGLSQ